MLEQRHGAQRQHQQREPLRAQQHKAACKADCPGHQRRGEQAGERFVPTPMHRHHADRIGTRAKERRMAQRHDARVAQHQVQRQREQDGDQHLRAKSQVIREREEAGEGRDPG